MTTTPTPASQPGAHHLTLENVAAVIKDLREIADGTTERSIYSRDWVAYSAVLALIIEWLAGKAQESAPSSESIGTPEFDELLDDYVSDYCVADRWGGKDDFAQSASSKAALVAYIDAVLARRATAGNAAPTEAPKGLEAAVNKYVDEFIDKNKRMPSWHEAFEGGAKWAASNTATAASGDLPPLPRSQHSYQTDSGSEFNASWKDAYTEDQMREYGRACIASNAGAAPK